MLKESDIEDVDLQGIANEIGAELDREKLRFSYPKLNFHLNIDEFLDEVEGEGETIVGDWEEGHLYVQVAAVFEDGTDLLVFSQDVRAAILHCLKVALMVCSGHSEEKEELYQQNPNLREMLAQA